MTTPQPLVPDTALIAYCGLYCATCRSYIKGKCPGCAKNEKATWCKTRTCCIDNSYGSCADCTTHANAMDCKKFNNVIAKVFSVVFNSDRKACLDMIKTSGRDGFAAYMAQNHLQTLKRRR